MGTSSARSLTVSPPLGNTDRGVLIYKSASNNTVSGNTIAHNGGNGIEIRSGSTGNTVLSNSIFSNVGLGIELNQDGVTANDPNDGDTGANDLQNHPVLTAAVWGLSVITRVDGTLNTTPNKSVAVQLFSNSSCDPSGYGEGETLLDTFEVVADGDGDAAISHHIEGFIPAGLYITASATDDQNNTSEFSPCVQVIRPEGVPGLTGLGLVAAAGLFTAALVLGLRRRRVVATR